MLIAALLLILILEVGWLIYRLERCQRPQDPFTPSVRVEVTEPGPDALVELLQRDANGTWQHHSWRPSCHHDINEALATPGLAVRRGTTIEEGAQ